MRSLSIAASVALLVVSMGFSTAHAQTTPNKIATANPAKIFSALQETTDLKSKMDSDRKTLESTDLEKRTKLRDLQAAREQFKPDTAGYADKGKELLQASVDYKVWGEVAKADTERQQKQQIRALFDKIAAAVEVVAKSKQIDLVIAEQKPEFPQDMDQITLQQLQLLISQRNVLYSNAAVDISDAVVAEMDAKYKSGK